MNYKNKYSDTAEFWQRPWVQEEEVDERGCNALHILCCLWKYENDNWKIWKLLERGFKPNTPNEAGMTPVHYAVMSENFVALDLLMAYNGDINFLDKNGDPPFFHLRFCRHMVHIHKFDPNLKLTDRNGNNIFQYFLRIDSCDTIIPFLWLTKFDVNFGNVNKQGDNCLHTLAQYNRFHLFHGYKNDPKIKLVKFLLNNGAYVNDKNSRQETPLHKAVLYDAELVSVFLHAGAKIDILNEDNLSPLDIAIERRDYALREIIRYMVFLKHRNLPNDQKNMDLIYSKQRLRNIFDEFEGHMESLKNMRIIPSSPTTYYHIISSNNNELVNIVSNSQIMAMLNTMEKLIARHPYMKEILILIEKGKTMKDERLVVNILGEILGNGLPYVCLRNIVKYMPPEELKRWIEMNDNGGL